MKWIYIFLIFLAIPGLSILALDLGGEHPEEPGEKVLISLDPVVSGPALHGIIKLGEELEKRGLTVSKTRTDLNETADYYILTGLSGSEGIAEINLKVENIEIPGSKESLVIQKTTHRGRPALILGGSDEVGLMYACLDVANRMKWTPVDQDLFQLVRNVQEEPFLLERSVSKYTMQRSQFERFLHDESHMEAYFDMLASSRINSFVLIFGYENGGFMAPAYPYFFDVEGFPEVKLVGTSMQQQTRNSEAFTRLIEIAHERGIRITPAFWDYIYRGEVQGGGIPGASERAGKRTPHLVDGVTTENLISYNKAALEKFVEVFPAIDAIQFRIHWESGLTRDETPGFWHDMFSHIKKTRPDIKLDLRAKGLPDVVVEDAVNMGLDFRITTKYWMEQMGLPFHPTHINVQNQKDRRHGYADLLKYPKRYQIHWRMWSGGTTRFLLWSDPEYVRRFALAARLYDGNSFEVNEMLATKMLGEDHSAEPFQLLTPDFQYYRYEFERYWAYYTVWGRMSYNPDINDEILELEYAGKFGNEAGKALMHGLELASQVLPRIVAASYPYRHFPTTRGWAEMQRQYDLPAYAKAEGSDIQQFMNMDEYADLLIIGSATPKRTPLQTSRWFRTTSDEILAWVSKAEDGVVNRKNNEFVSTVTDLKILAHLAAYHSYRLIAGIHYNLYEKRDDPHALDDAIAQEEAARDAWARIVEAAGNIYSRELIFGVEAVGFSKHWKDQLEELDRGLEALKGLRAGLSLSPEQEKKDYLAVKGAMEQEAPTVTLERVSRAIPGKDLTINARVSDPSGVNWVRLRYRHLTQFEDYLTLEMKLDPDKGTYSAQIPGEFILPEWDLIYFIEAMDSLGNGCMIPDLELEMPYVIVRTSK